MESVKSSYVILNWRLLLVPILLYNKVRLVEWQQITEAFASIFDY